MDGAFELPRVFAGYFNRNRARYIRNLDKKRCHQALDLLEKVNIIKQIIHPDRARICLIHRGFWGMNRAINDSTVR